MCLFKTCRWKMDNSNLCDEWFNSPSSLDETNHNSQFRKKRSLKRKSSSTTRSNTLRLPTNRGGKSPRGTGRYKYRRGPEQLCFNPSDELQSYCDHRSKHSLCQKKVQNPPSWFELLSASNDVSKRPKRRTNLYERPTLGITTPKVPTNTPEYWELDDPSTCGRSTVSVGAVTTRVKSASRQRRGRSAKRVLSRSPTIAGISTSKFAARASVRGTAHHYSSVAPKLKSNNTSEFLDILTPDSKFKLSPSSTCIRNSPGLGKEGIKRYEKIPSSGILKDPSWDLERKFQECVSYLTSSSKSEGDTWKLEGENSIGYSAHHARPRRKEVSWNVESQIPCIPPLIPCSTPERTSWSIESEIPKYSSTFKPTFPFPRKGTSSNQKSGIQKRTSRANSKDSLRVLESMTKSLQKAARELEAVKSTENHSRSLSRFSEGSLSPRSTQTSISTSSGKEERILYSSSISNPIEKSTSTVSREKINKESDIATPTKNQNTSNDSCCCCDRVAKCGRPAAYCQRCQHKCQRQWPCQAFRCWQGFGQPPPPPPPLTPSSSATDSRCMIVYPGARGFGPSSLTNGGAQTSGFGGFSLGGGKPMGWPPPFALAPCPPWTLQHCEQCGSNLECHACRKKREKKSKKSSSDTSLSEESSDYETKSETESESENEESGTDSEESPEIASSISGKKVQRKAQRGQRKSQRAGSLGKKKLKPIAEVKVAPKKSAKPQISQKSKVFNGDNQCSCKFCFGNRKSRTDDCDCICVCKENRTGVREQRTKQERLACRLTDRETQTIINPMRKEREMTIFRIPAICIKSDEYRSRAVPERTITAQVSDDRKSAVEEQRFSRQRTSQQQQSIYKQTKKCPNNYIVILQNNDDGVGDNNECVRECAEPTANERNCNCIYRDQVAAAKKQTVVYTKSIIGQGESFQKGKPSTTNTTECTEQCPCESNASTYVKCECLCTCKSDDSLSKHRIARQNTETMQEQKVQAWNAQLKVSKTDDNDRHECTDQCTCQESKFAADNCDCICNCAAKLRNSETQTDMKGLIDSIGTSLSESRKYDSISEDEKENGKLIRNTRTENVGKYKKNSEIRRDIEMVSISSALAQDTESFIGQEESFQNGQPSTTNTTECTEQCPCESNASTYVKCECLCTCKSDDSLSKHRIARQNTGTMQEQKVQAWNAQLKVSKTDDNDRHECTDQCTCQESKLAADNCDCICNCAAKLRNSETQTDMKGLTDSIGYNLSESGKYDSISEDKNENRKLISNARTENVGKRKKKSVMRRDTEVVPLSSAQEKDQLAFFARGCSSSCRFCPCCMRCCPRALR